MAPHLIRVWGTIKGTHMCTLHYTYTCRHPHQHTHTHTTHALIAGYGLVERKWQISIQKRRGVFLVLAYNRTVKRKSVSDHRSDVLKGSPPNVFLPILRTWKIQTSKAEWRELALLKVLTPILLVVGETTRSELRDVKRVIIICTDKL